MNPYAGPSDYSREASATISPKAIGKPGATETKEKP